MHAPLRLAVIVGSTRTGRFGPVVARWFATRVARHPDLELDLVDLASFDLPAVYPSSPDPGLDDLLARLGRADAFVVVTPEYNHGYPASLKQAIDLTGEEWHAKPVGFVSYGGISGGLRAVEQLRQVFAELHAVTVRTSVSFPHHRERFDENGGLRDPARWENAAGSMLGQLSWWGHALRDARTAHPYAA